MANSPIKPVGEIRCQLVNGKRVCPLTDVRKAAGSSRQALHDAIKRGTVQTVKLFDQVLIPQAQAKKYVAAATARRAAAKRPTSRKAKP